MLLTRLWRKHHEAAKFLMVGGVCFLATTFINYALKLTVLHEKPVTALAIATVLSTILSYVLNREWSFRTRGGREQRHEAALFFAVSAVGIVLTLIPLWVSRYVLLLRVPEVSRPAQEIADFVSGIILGTLLAMVFRLWAFKKFVFPHPEARPRPASRRSARGPRSPITKHKPVKRARR
ncbi:GtrA family protein [Paractinoplanes atraurantiacus]|uniref:Putative flippase GtrA (Transmembrane translocase of bactoprenol-linked glucose) n=1 Tax=Paractinoplanes atraurantiacus TaxID=1036182 RepID=A0A285K439_9ACTN|nr:GtrA family protein [Actinoplanes atraurantiacus]SNY67033.1 Putative flippase GtrA (transmembrane translocase of bactoprenol-linked glucose) [Actinoplanes atraurantiacus]